MRHGEVQRPPQPRRPQLAGAPRRPGLLRRRPPTTHSPRGHVATCRRSTTAHRHHGAVAAAHRPRSRTQRIPIHTCRCRIGLSITSRHPRCHRVSRGRPGSRAREAVVPAAGRAHATAFCKSATGVATTESRDTFRDPLLSPPLPTGASILPERTSVRHRLGRPRGTAVDTQALKMKLIYT